MLVTFSWPAFADITMFRGVAVWSLTLMGHSGRAPGAWLANDVGVSLKRREAALQRPRHRRGAAEDENAEQVLSLQHRAFPLIELLCAAEKPKVDVMWDKDI